MSSRPPVPTDDRRRPAPWWLAFVLYPFVAMSVAINLFMLGLLGTWLGWGNIQPVSALIAALILALPADYLATRWVQRLLDRAEVR